MSRRAAHPRAVGGFGALIALALLAMAFAPPTMPWNAPRHIHIEVQSVGALNPGASVDLNGVRVGQVQSVAYGDGYATLDAAIDPASARRLHSDASASVQPHGLLGPKYIELDGGTTGSLDNATITLAHSHVAVDFDQVLNSLQPDVRQSLQTILVELGTASQGRGDDMHVAVTALGQSAPDVTAVTDAVHQQDPAVGDLFVAGESLDRDVQDAPISANIADTDRVLTGLVTVENSIGSGIDHTGSVLGSMQQIMQDNAANLASTLHEAPGSLAQVTAFLNAVAALVSGISPQVPALLTATVETDSTFSGYDANGHYGQVYMIHGPCSAGTTSPPPPGNCATPPQYGIPGAQSSSQPAGPSLSDDQLLDLLLNN